MKLILVVEDDEKIRANVVSELRDEGFGVVAVRSAEEAREHLNDRKGVAIDLLLLDVRLPKMSGVELVRELSTAGLLPATIVISGEASISETVEALQLGVHDFIEKPFTRERLLQSVRNCLRQQELDREVLRLRQSMRGDSAILGRSPEIETLRRQIAQVAPTTARVLIRGESGTGKELVATAIHQQSQRRSGPFIRINCAAIPPHLVEDELFGHIRGAFTDAKTTKRGLFEEADRGTLFLDEIGDMEYSLQSRLLRVLEDGVVRRVGDTVDRKVDVRVVAATNVDIEKQIAERTFREDLYFRLSAVPLHVPPLRQRSVDIGPLFVHFLDHFCRQHQRPRLGVEPDTLLQLIEYRWPGNVRELRNVCERLAVFATDPITVDQLPSSLVTTAAVAAPADALQATTAAIIPLRDFRAHCERDYIETVLKKTAWNFSRAAQLLQIQRTYLHQKVASLGIRRPSSIPDDGDHSG